MVTKCAFLLLQKRLETLRPLETLETVLNSASGPAKLWNMEEASGKDVRSRCGGQL